MAICKFCNKEMLEVNDCAANREITYPDGGKLPALTYHFIEGSDRCHDCNITNGNYHHPGCDMERCPRCLGQLISCSCFDEEEDP